MHDWQTGCRRDLFKGQFDECRMCGKDLVTPEERDAGICDDCALKIEETERDYANIDESRKDTLRRLKEGLKKMRENQGGK